MKILKLLALFTLLISPSLWSAPKVYGQLKLSVSYQDESNQINSMGSRFGIKGSEKLSETSSQNLIYQAEFGIVPNDQRSTLTDSGSNTHTSSSPFTGRDIFLGIEGQWGKVRIGRISTEYKLITSATDPFYHTSAGATHSGSTYGLSEVDNGRLDNTLSYIYKREFYDLSLSLILDETHKSQNDYTLGVNVNAFEFIKFSFHLLQDNNIDKNNEKKYLKLFVAHQFKSYEIGTTFQVMKKPKLESTSATYSYTYANYNFNKESKLSLSYGIETDYLNGSKYEKEGASYSLGYFHKLNNLMTVHALASVVDYKLSTNKEDIETLSIGAHLKF